MDYFFPLMTGHLRTSDEGRWGRWGRGGRGGTGAEPRLSKGQVNPNLSSAKGGDRRKSSGGYELVGSVRQRLLF